MPAGGPKFSLKLRGNVSPTANSYDVLAKQLTSIENDLENSSFYFVQFRRKNTNIVCQTFLLIWTNMNFDDI